MATRPRRGDDLPPLEGSPTGGNSMSIKDTKYSSMPSFRSNASVMDDIKKITASPTKAKGAAKRAVELAEERAINRMAVRGAGAAGAGAAAKALTSEDKPKKASAAAEDYEDMSGDVSADFSNPTGVAGTGMKKGGMTASRRGDGIAQRGKTKGTMVMCGGGMSRGRK